MHYCILSVMRDLIDKQRAHLKSGVPCSERLMDSLLSTGNFCRTSKKELDWRWLVAITSGGSGSGGSSVTANLTATAVVGVIVEANNCCQGAAISADIYRPKGFFRVFLAVFFIIIIITRSILCLMFSSVYVCTLYILHSSIKLSFINFCSVLVNWS